MSIVVPGYALSLYIEDNVGIIVALKKAIKFYDAGMSAKTFIVDTNDIQVNNKDRFKAKKHAHFRFSPIF